MKALARLYARRYPSLGGCTPEQVRELAALSRSIGRQLGLLIHNRHGGAGRPFKVLVGEPGGILIPELPRSREGAGRLRGLRFVHTHLSPDLLSDEDCQDLLFLRLDSIGVYSVNEWGEPLRFQHAHLLPPNPEKRSYVISEPSRWDAVTTDFTAEAEALEAELARIVSAAADIADADRRAVLVSVSTSSRREQESALAELAELARSAGLAVAGTLVQRVKVMNPRHILGKGKLAELEITALRGNAGLIVFDGELSPAQLGNLAEVTERRVLDRTQLILDIFSRRALSRAGKYQVELAQLQYMLPRLVGKSRALDRLAGGIGGRGPGESKLETDRRRLRNRVTRLKEALKTLRRQRAQVRSRRAKGGVPALSLVGYTNAGKSTLLNALTGAEVLAENRLFATLDPTTRRLRFPAERELVISDTVGFIRSLPKELVEAFRATLEELEDADMLLHVADASHPELDEQIAAVNAILEELGLDRAPCMLVLNKIDALPGDPDPESGLTPRQSLRRNHPEAFFISAISGEGLAGLSSALESRIDWERAQGIEDADNVLSREALPLAAPATGG
ncbi:GTPase HflX [Desulfovibrio sp. OttesenSCG-928-G11]|nr:GTPase HflX [Desulfovibrio sp. OttesenSCG-928-G11]